MPKSLDFSWCQISQLDNNLKPKSSEEWLSFLGQCAIISISLPQKHFKISPHPILHSAELSYVTLNVTYKLLTVISLK